MIPRLLAVLVERYPVARGQSRRPSDRVDRRTAGHRTAGGRIEPGDQVVAAVVRADQQDLAGPSCVRRGHPGPLAEHLVEPPYWDASSEVTYLAERDPAAEVGPR